MSQLQICLSTVATRSISRASRGSLARPRWTIWRSPLEHAVHRRLAADVDLLVGKQGHDLMRAQLGLLGLIDYLYHRLAFLLGELVGRCGLGAEAAGAWRKVACAEFGFSLRTLERGEPQGSAKDCSLSFRQL